MLLTEIIEDYLNHCKVERGLTTRTYKTFGSWLRFYAKWLFGTGYDRLPWGSSTPPRSNATSTTGEPEVSPAHHPRGSRRPEECDNLGRSPRTPSVR